MVPREPGSSPPHHWLLKLKGQEGQLNHATSNGVGYEAKKTVRFTAKQRDGDRERRGGTLRKRLSPPNQFSSVKKRISNPFLVNHAPPSAGDTKDGKQNRPPFPIYTLALLHRYFWLCESLPAWEGKGRLNPRLHLQGSEQAGTRSWGVSPLYTLHLLEKK